MQATELSQAGTTTDDVTLRALFARTADLSYFLRPLAGWISGLMVFFLLLGGAMTLNIGVHDFAVSGVWVARVHAEAQGPGGLVVCVEGQGGVTPIRSRQDGVDG